MLYRYQGKINHVVKMHCLREINQLPELKILDRVQFRRLFFICDEGLEILKRQAWIHEERSVFRLAWEGDDLIKVTIEIPSYPQASSLRSDLRSFAGLQEHEFIRQRKHLIKYWVMTQQEKAKITDYPSNDEVCDLLRWLSLYWITKDHIRLDIQAIDDKASLYVFDFLKSIKR